MSTYRVLGLSIDICAHRSSERYFQIGKFEKRHSLPRSQILRYSYKTLQDYHRHQYEEIYRPDFWYLFWNLQNNFFCIFPLDLLKKRRFFTQKIIFLSFQDENQKTGL